MVKFMQARTIILCAALALVCVIGLIAAAVSPKQTSPDYSEYLVSDINNYKTYYHNGEWWVFDPDDRLFSYQTYLSPASHAQSIINYANTLPSFNATTAEYYVIRDKDGYYTSASAQINTQLIDLSHILPKSTLNDTFTLFIQWTDGDIYYTATIPEYNAALYRYSKSDSITFSKIYNISN